MKIRLVAAAALVAFAFIIQGCFNSPPAETSAAGFSYPKWYGQPYAYAPYDPNGTYYYQPYQYPYPYYYEGYYEHDCGDVPCGDQRKYWRPPIEARAEPVKIPAAAAQPTPAAPSGKKSGTK